MLVNRSSDAEFLRYCDDEETPLYHALWPILTAGARISDPRVTHPQQQARLGARVL